jgi:hypothetical protein
MYFQDDLQLKRNRRFAKKRSKIKVGMSTGPKSLAKCSHTETHNENSARAFRPKPLPQSTKWLQFKRIVESRNRHELLVQREALQDLVPNSQSYKCLIKSKICDGDESICLKATSAFIVGNVAYDASVVADHNGCDVSRWLKFARDRTLQENIRFSNFKGAMRFLDLGFVECLEESTPRLTIVAGLCKTIDSFAKTNWPDIDFPKLRNGIMPLQSGLLLMVILRSPRLDEFLAIDWQEPNAAERLLSSSNTLSCHLQEVIDRVNLDIQEIPRLAEVIDLVDIENASEFLSIGVPHAWQWYLLSEMVPSEWMQEARYSMTGVFDEFWSLDQDYRDAFYWSPNNGKH